ncbi:hypothetical protein [Clostridium beijerinckii]|uniref:hypothetical protein n=1 Tax=Clostridium beijerinckii TaxID=1520 RepID=UPI0015703C33|nr:hypothetical protein [Clostridium beijerinckii]NRX48567.1 hypothetical protein [Clostridium beijerinckii]
MNEMHWRFVSNLNAGDDGLNDAGIETFTANMTYSLVRETIQNAIDAKNKENQNPVIVEFNDFYIKPTEFPNNQEFIEILGKCLASNKGDATTVEFFEHAISVFSQSIPVLRISDYNTCGLEGAESGLKGTKWHSLIKSSGSSNKELNSGGSFGIGKSATFSCSDLRTVLYASKDSSGIDSYIGVSRLVSHEEESGKWTVGKGYFTESDKMNAILESFSLDGYIRNEPGTDMYVLGFSELDNLKYNIIESTIKNFIVSIWKEKLIVKYKDIIISKNTLGQHIGKLSSKRYQDIQNYYYILSSKDPSILHIALKKEEYGEKYGFGDGECELLLMEGEEFNRNILMTRSAGMSLFEQNNIHGSISFTGILMITGDKMNEVFKKNGDAST